MEGMFLLYTFIQLWVVHTAFSASTNTSLFGPSPRKNRTFVDLASSDGYKAEHHYVTTSDGYILGVFRVPPRENCTATKGVIMFMHGLYLSADDCIIPGPNIAHCYIYADNCYDVWVPNVRGNFYSRNHTKYDPDKDSSFWDFSVDEMAVYDLSVSIDHVLNVTNNSQLSFVGHSQGVSMLLILCSKKPEYNDKIKIGVGLSVTAWLDHSKFIVLQIQGLLDPVLTLATNLGVNSEVLPRGGLVQSAGNVLCGLTNVTYPICSAFIFAVLGYNEYQITSDILPVVVGHTPSGTSLKNFNRWGQIKNNGFSEYDYGTIKNLLVYRQISPPAYDVSKVTMPWVFIGSDNDYVANVTDVEYLVSKVANSSLCVVSDELFGHLDFIYGKDIPKYVIPTVLAAIEDGIQQCF